ncbi:1-acyl-sn-glycerol-3-phosphate acyltransferase [Flavobacterium nackdongense]|uniref:Acyltransferase n=1 Tax=Flavobacterium nackdongense TaxID=2547394 RepID=A0A4P6YAN7_9FLAO|nr:1-acyl-sn-glycerol-3-phosphate acyltransferase [Flavobacterium nackdongense]QBN17320.1 acyltransferase [Flavobacterium nackdongense]
MKKSFYKLIFFKMMGWKITGAFDENIKKCVLMVLPHTSWHDFYLGIFTRGIVGLEMNFIAKKELFRFPFGYYFRWMGGAPIDRVGSLNKVEAIAKIFENHTEFRLAISPEGTRKKTSELRSGFYYIALKANVPIIPVAFDFGKKEVNVGEPFFPTANYEQDLKIILDHFQGVLGKIPENGFTPLN